MYSRGMLADTMPALLSRADAFLHEEKTSELKAASQKCDDESALIAEWQPVLDAAIKEWQACPFEIGLCVTLHSLSKADLNGRNGELLAWQEDKARWTVQLVGEDKPILVRPVNLHRMDPAAATARSDAAMLAQQAEQIFLGVREKYGVDASGRLCSLDGRPDVMRAKALLEQAAASDPSSAIVAKGLGDVAVALGDATARLRQFQRAVANGHGLVAEDGSQGERNYNLLQNRVCLATALGERQDLEGESQQLRKVLRHAPGHLIARLTLGQNFLDRNQPDDAVPELMMALQLKADDKFVPPKYGAIIKEQAALLLLSTCGRRAAKRAEEGDHAGAVQMLESALKVPSPSKDDLARTEGNLATSLMALGKLAEAEVAILRGGGHAPSHNTARAFLEMLRGRLLEMRADTARSDGNGDEASRLYADSKAAYASANAMCDDPSTHQAHARVQAKSHPLLEWVDLEGMGGPNSFGGGLARVRDGDSAGTSVDALLETLPRGPSPEPGTHRMPIIR